MSLDKALQWLGARCGVTEVRVKHYLVAYIYRLPRENKPDIRYCVDMRTFWEPTRVRRICTY